MCGLACAADALSATAAHAAAKTASSVLDMRRLPAERRQPAAQPFLQVDFRLPAEHLACACDVRPADFRIVDRPRFERDLARRARDANHRLGELKHCHLVIWIADVYRKVLAGLREHDQATNGVVYVAEAARLGAV